MSHKEDKVPHVVSQDMGAHDLALKTQGVASTKGNHSGRPHPPTEKAGGLHDYAAGAENGGILTQD